MDRFHDRLADAQDILAALEVIHIVLLGTWNEVVFNGIMLVVGTIVGAVWGRQNG